MEKIQKTSRIINKVLSVLFWICAIGLGLILFAVVVLFATRNTGFITKLTFGDLTLTLAEGVAVKNPIWLTDLISGIPLAAMTLWEIKILKDIFRPMADGLPFNGSVSKSIRKLAWIRLAAGLLSSVLEFGMSRMTARSIDIASLFDPEKVTACSLTDTPSGNFMVALVSFFLLLLLSHIFRYGEELQKLSDETL